MRQKKEKIIVTIFQNSVSRVGCRDRIVCQRHRQSGVPVYNQKVGDNQNWQVREGGKRSQCLT
jgi:hypothetical protein